MWRLFDEQLECVHGPQPAHIPTTFASLFPGTFQLLLVVPESPEGLSGTGVRRRASRAASRQYLTRLRAARASVA